MTCFKYASEVIECEVKYTKPPEQSQNTIGEQKRQERLEYTKRGIQKPELEGQTMQGLQGQAMVC